MKYNSQLVAEQRRRDKIHELKGIIPLWKARYVIWKAMEMGADFDDAYDALKDVLRQQGKTIKVNAK